MPRESASLSAELAALRNLRFYSGFVMQRDYNGFGDLQCK